MKSELEIIKKINEIWYNNKLPKTFMKSIGLENVNIHDILLSLNDKKDGFDLAILYDNTYDGSDIKYIKFSKLEEYFDLDKLEFKVGV